MRVQMVPSPNDRKGQIPGVDGMVDFDDNELIHQSARLSLHFGLPVDGPVINRHRRN